MPKEPGDRWTETKVFNQLRHIFPSPAFVRIPQVRNGTGFARKVDRTADAVILSVWPSRGLYMAGVEIKVTRSDWRKELAHPDKAAEMEKYCRQWYIAAPKGVVPVAELPEAWGLVEVTGNTAVIEKEAVTKKEWLPPDMLLLCSILRAMAAVTVPVDSLRDEVDAAREEAMKGMVPEYDVKVLRDTIDAFEAASGVKLGDYRFESKKLGEQIKFLEDVGFDHVQATIKRLREAAATSLECIDRAYAAMKAAPDA